MEFDIEAELDNCMTYEGLQGDDRFEFNHPFPRCNHIKGITKYNCGYSQGYLDTYVPFDAEIFYNDDKDIWLAVVLPILCDDNEELEHWDTSDWDKSILVKGMQELGISDNSEALFYYEDVLMQNDIIEADRRMGADFLKYFIDDEGQKFAQVFTLLRTVEEDKDDSITYATTDIELFGFYEGE